MSKKVNIFLIIIGAFLVLGIGMIINYYNKKNVITDIGMGQPNVFQKQSTTPQQTLLIQGEIDSWKIYRNEQYGFEVKYPPIKESFENIFTISAAPNMYLCPLNRNRAEYKFLTDEQFKNGVEIVSGAGLCK
ncbi:MAG: hypothetical protein ACYC3G_02155, partial [Minisyncoccota bacterium]